MFSPISPRLRLLRFASPARSPLAEPVAPGSRPTAYEANTQLRHLIKANRLRDARLVFDGMPHRDDVSWTVIISGYVGASDPHEALFLFSLMRSVDPSLDPDPFVLSVALKACASGPALGFHGRCLHAYTLKSGKATGSVFVGTALLDMYSKIGAHDSALRSFDEMPSRNAVSWTSAVAALVRAGRCRDAVRCFAEMWASAMPCDSHTYATALKACADARLLDRGREIHAHVAKLGLETSSFVANTLASLYTKCGVLQPGLVLLDRMRSRDVISWTTIIVAYVQTGREEEAIRAFVRMQADPSDAVSPNDYTFAALISASVGLAQITLGQQLHASVIRRGCVAASSVSNALVTLYARAGHLASAYTIFQHTMLKDIVSWTAIISGFCLEHDVEKAFSLFGEMRRAAWPPPNEYTFPSLLGLCAWAAALEVGQQLHARAVVAGLDNDVMITSALIALYSKSGSLEEAARVFEGRNSEEVVSWTAMIKGYAEHGRSAEAIELFDRMKSTAGMRPDGVAFIGVLTACCHAGLVDRGIRYFLSMRTEHGVEPGREHYGCIVDLLGRAGRVKQAEKVIEEMPRSEVDGVVWAALMRACVAKGDEEGGRRAAAMVKELEPGGAGAYVVLANLYAGQGRWQEAAAERKKMREEGVRKEAGWSCVGVGREETGVFVAGDRSHRRMEDICEMLELIDFAARMGGDYTETEYEAAAAAAEYCMIWPM
ncbi:putative pentatricopeptide repeat-containing protein At3g47840 [Musa acuminata AAA Group]|uniref:putative pentatricopeptide repeat-containing protein At3g47840 n=1 Tax=Musa acuminata AAA Group TaxID=214697 RepID=UPI0031D5424D